MRCLDAISCLYVRRCLGVRCFIDVGCLLDARRCSFVGSCVEMFGCEMLDVEDACI